MNAIRRNMTRGMRASANSLLDYADTTFRYSRITGLLALDGSRVVIRPEKNLLVKKILAREPIFSSKNSPRNYLQELYNGASIPTDNQTFARRETLDLQHILRGKGIAPTISDEEIRQSTLEDLTPIRYRLEETLLHQKEDEFANEHVYNSAVIDDVHNYLSAIQSKHVGELIIEDFPAYLEWAVWRALLIFNSLTEHPSKTRNFEVDLDIRPIGHAPAGRPDIMMTYEDFKLIVEVTLTSGSRQEAAEGEPVRRHVADAAIRHGADAVYGLFVAPKINLNTAETFRRGSWYEGQDQIRVNILPLSVNQLISMIESLKIRRRTPRDVRDLIDACLAFRDSSAPEWLMSIKDNVEQWVAPKPA